MSLDSRSQSILIVDDSPTDLMMFQRALSAPNRVIVTAESGEEALSLAQDSDFAAIILDVEMPGINGYETAEQFREIPASAKAPIIFVTATQNEQEHIFQGYSSGAVDYLLKPIPRDLLRSKVNVFCDLHAQRAQIQDSLNEIQAQKDELERQLSEIKVLRGLVPLCVSCKKVRDDTGYWEAIETYLGQRSEAEFSHAVCPDCSAELYPEFQPKAQRAASTA